MMTTVKERLFQLYQDGRSIPGLISIKRLLKYLGDPQEGVACIHVAGTNGKGSTCAYIESILREAGLETGFFSSPHLQIYNEYIRLNGLMISDDEMEGYLKRVFEACDSIARQGHELPTFFEVMTACAYLCFADRPVDIAVIETGLGGRLDATNVITPLVSVITQIGLDHTAVLGRSIDNIAREKAGIIKEGVPLVLARQQYSLPQMVIRSICEHSSSQCIDTE
ncbi:MAG: bifunctional folylpolyglutamate synthase/dihydrofolate synthase, partial [Proteobacteria bacterium]|nr:bifunctional folylpolyglutamate synthase/dihydrofolate synthase [Pseudomonadota bacterium]